MILDGVSYSVFIHFCRVILYRMLNTTHRTKRSTSESSSPRLVDLPSGEEGVSTRSKVSVYQLHVSVSADKLKTENLTSSTIFNCSP